MSVTLSGRNSKFTGALNAMLDSAVANKIEFLKAVISDNGSDWELYFSADETLSQEETDLLHAAIRKIVPGGVAFRTHVETADEPDDPLPRQFHGEPAGETVVSQRVLPPEAPRFTETPEKTENTPENPAPTPQKSGFVPPERHKAAAGPAEEKTAETAPKRAAFIPPTRAEGKAMGFGGRSGLMEKNTDAAAAETLVSTKMQAADENIYDAVPLPEDAPMMPEEDIPIPQDAPEEITEDDSEPLPDVAADQGDSALERYRKRMEQLSREAAQTAAAPKPEKKPEKKVSLSKDGIAIYGKDFVPKEITAINTLNDFSGRVTIMGDVISKEVRELRDGKHSIFLFAVTDYTSTISGKMYLTNEEAAELNDTLDGHIAIAGSCMVDSFGSELIIKPYNVIKVKEEKKTDDAKVKRIEMHLHTKMSQMDGVVDAKQLVKLMMQYGHDTVAITDHGVVQAYPDMEDAIGKYKANIKLILGMEGYLLDDDPLVQGLPDEARLDGQRYCVFAIRTAGASALTGKIIEIGACIYENGLLQEGTYHSYINPHEPVDQKILTEHYIDQRYLDAAPEMEPVMRGFFDFARGAVLVNHNAAANMPFMRMAAEQLGEPLEHPVIDTLRLAREFVPNIKSGKFNKVCEALEIRAGEITDAMKEAAINARIVEKLWNLLKERNVEDVGGLNHALDVDGGDSYHIILYAKNKKGLFNLYSLVTESHLYHLRKKRPQIPRSSLIAHREGLIIASACEAGELYRAILRGVPDQKLEEIASFYDYLEVQPLGNNEFMLREGIVKDRQQLIDLNMKIIELGEKLGRPVLATGDVHYLLPRDAIYRSVIQCAEGYPEANIQPPLYYRTTQEMLDEFSYLPKDKAYEIVVTNPRAVADQCEKMESFPRDHLYTPEMDHAEEDLREMCERKAHDIYGEVLPDIVAKRLERELTAIIKNGYAVLYLIAHKVVKKSLSDGYLVGSRGSVGSSFAATMADITEVNPLTPHYVCPNCKYSDFDIDLNKYDCGIDMPRANCPKCGTEMLRLGFNIPFEVFMGFDGDKVPDIDLNFSGVYQPVVHKYIEELFGEKYVYRAGTIGGVADKTAIGYAKKYCEEYGLGRQRMAELTRMASGCIDVKRTTGQHAGGVVILPKKYDVNEFTPLQYPANDPSQGIITTHFTFHSLHDTILKADILGHDDPTVIRMLEDMTGIDAKKDVPLDDPMVMDLFLSPKSLGLTEEELGAKTGTFGIPEFGTGFTRQMLEDTKPKTFSDLVKISGLSHGTDVWLGNAKDLIDNGTANISQCICTREDIMNGLLLKGVANFTSFDTMEKVRKGKGIPEKYLEEIRAHDVPEWFIDSCNKIKYMFPKAHAAAYVTMALRIAWFKVHKPHQYYATYFTVRADDFEIGLAFKNVAEIRKMLADYRERNDLNPREKGIVVMLEMELEMKLRGVEFTNVDIYRSEATKFTVTEDNLIRPPLNTVPNLGENAAISIVEARNQEPFKSQDDLLARTKLSTSLMQALEECGCLKDLPKSQQISLFEL